MDNKDYSLDALNRFFDHASSKGLIKRNTAQSRKAATNKILTVLDPSELNDLRALDLEHTFERFKNLQGMQYKPDSLQVYISRARTAIIDFTSYVDDPAAFKASTQQRSSARVKSDQNNGLKVKTNKKQGASVDAADTATPDEVNGLSNLVVPVPLREQLTVKIVNLPADLTVAEAERLAAIVKAYAVPSVK